MENIGNPSYIEETVRKQREFFMTGKTRSLEFRINSLKKLKKVIEDKQGRIAEALKQDLNKAPMEAYMCETGLVLDEIGYHIKHLSKWMKEKRVRTPLAQFPSKSFISPEPYGVVLIMSPWNYPVQLCLEPLVGAISAGNCAVLKPSAYAPESGNIVKEIIEEAFPSEYVAVIEGGRKENQALFGQKFDHIFFTGSVEVGKEAMAAAAKNLTPVTLELGGKSPVIIDKTADIRVAARRVAFGKVINAGQTCVGPDYVLIEESVREDFIEGFRKALGEFFPDGDMSSMVNIVSEKHYLRKKELLESQKTAVGGGWDDSRRFIEPTVLVDVDPESPVMQEEIFGPILPVMTWRDIREAVDFVNSRPKPLAFYLFTTDDSIERRILDSCSFGGGCINDTIVHLATPYMGFGGVGNSGMGQYHGKKSFDTFTHYRSILKKNSRIDLPMRYMPYTESKFNMIKKFLK
ncbi:MAG: aldehyde dehydrogenase [Clostridiales bacterium]|nr:aldehyde dehydrogenase [Clostridiales bacterium]